MRIAVTVPIAPSAIAVTDRGMRRMVALIERGAIANAGAADRRRHCLRHPPASPPLASRTAPACPQPRPPPPLRDADGSALRHIPPARPDLSAALDRRIGPRAKRSCRTSRRRIRIGNRDNAPPAAGMAGAAIIPRNPAETDDAPPDRSGRAEGLRNYLASPALRQIDQFSPSHLFIADVTPDSVRGGMAVGGVCGARTIFMAVALGRPSQPSAVS